MPKAEDLAAGATFRWLGQTMTVVGPPYESGDDPPVIVISCVNQDRRNRTVRVTKGTVL